MPVAGHECGNITFLTFDGVGHMVQYSAPEATANFIKSLAARALHA